MKAAALRFSQTSGGQRKAQRLEAERLEVKRLEVGKLEPEQRDTNEPERRTPVHLEFSAATLTRLFASGQLHGNDFRCMDGKSKECVRAICLSLLAQELGTC